MIRNPETHESLEAGPGVRQQATTIKAMIDVLWAGWKHECCSKKNAYHLVFPENISADDKLVLLGSTVLLDITMFENEDDDN